ncbi:hypothetical protein [Bradyrhizobium sp. AUGA SZCCT0160]|uniref:hypothetical protein n=1 Tax=Bradyrhizobium sp. AUGA SZCCT0160 TaxID=2807662 RepID=UPI001BAD52E3|nr:hypothetical protein [Bradyrhizobium sp. AUGA SZCCT0160]MBR1193705.1 hypothetical protein [Bradyrhizobium sp. AUGA SZCCT0160]
MRETETGFWMVQKTSLTRAMRFAAVALGVGLVMAAGPVRAADDDEDDDRTFEEKIIHNIMTGLGGKNMESKGIDYRERSPLVVPPKLDLPPPAGASAAANAPNWPKDPDEARRKAAIAARKKENKDSSQSARALSPAELNVGRTAAPVRTNNDPVQPGTTNNAPQLSPSQLGYEGGLFGMFKGNKTESAEFKGEPPRQSLVEPPAGYQTPSPNFAYGTGPKESLNKNYDVMTGKER